MNENLRPVDGLVTHGLTPKAHAEWKLYEIDGWQLLVQPDENDDGEGWGVRYSTAIADEDIGTVSIWVGNPNENERTEALFDKMFADMDDTKARKSLQVLLDQVGPMVAARA